MSKTELLLNLIKSAPKLLEKIYDDLARPGVIKVGKALETIIEFGNTILLPIKLLNEKTHLNFQKHMEIYAGKLNEIPNEEIRQIEPEIGIPILDRLTYVTNEEIGELFINILTKASANSTANQAHPSFIFMLDRISVDEAKIIKAIQGRTWIPFITVHYYLLGGGGFEELPKFATGIEKELELLHPDKMPLYLQNFISMGIISDRSETRSIRVESYEDLKKKYRKDNEKALSDLPFDDFKYYHGVLKISEFGKFFLDACNISKGT